MKISYYIYLLLISSIIFSLDNESLLRQIDNFQEGSQFDEALQLSLECYNKYDSSDYPKEEILWRLARSYFDIADQSSDLEIQKKNIDSALPHAQKALEISPLLAKANHWYAVIIGKKGVLEGTKQKIINSYEVEKYCLKAIELDPAYDGSYHVMGRWHYNVADLSWLERNIASLVYATPPEGTFEAAAEYFKSAISAKSDEIRHYLWLGKSYYALSQYKNAEDILIQATKLEVINDSDRILMTQVETLLKEIE